MSAVLLEGRVCVLAALQAGRRRFEELRLGRSADRFKLDDVLQAAQAKGVPVRRVEDEELGAQAKSHGGVVAVVGPKPLTAAAELSAALERSRRAPLLVLLDGADDPRNLGYVLRTAEAFGADALLVRRRAWDLDETAVSRASSGAYERLPVVLVDRALSQLAELAPRGLTLVGCVPRARDSLYALDLKRPVILAVGGEKRGLSGEVREACGVLACVPTAGGPSSLSMTQAAAVVLGEAFRQRSLKPRS